MLGVDEDALASANNLTKPYHMQVGQQLRVPGGIGGEEYIASDGPVVAEPDYQRPAPHAAVSAAPSAPPPGVASGPGGRLPIAAAPTPAAPVQSSAGATRAQFANRACAATNGPVSADRPAAAGRAAGQDEFPRPHSPRLKRALQIAPPIMAAPQAAAAAASPPIGVGNRGSQPPVQAAAPVMTPSIANPAPAVLRPGSIS